VDNVDAGHHLEQLAGDMLHGAISGRASISAGPPAAKPTIQRTGRAG
jgi:hypothetical protein